MNKAEAINKARESEELYGIKVYGDEVPPIPLDDYTPMEIEQEIPKESFNYQSFEPPQGLNEFELASEYDAEFEIEENEQFKDILSDLGWHEEDNEE